MIKSIPTIKVGMTSSFDEAGTTVPVTILQPYKLVVTEIKRPEKHGYAAVQVAFRPNLAKRVTKPLKGITAKAGVKEVYSRFYEVHVAPEDLEQFQLGQLIDPAEFLSRWDQITVTGTSKGKGFAGVVKRWGFAGQQRTHGDPDNRRPMSNNATDPARVFPGSRRPGRMGNEQVTLKGLTVFEYDAKLNILVVSGSVPGHNGAQVFVNLVAEAAPEEEGA
jgi:large subunit ribosomal protein L3